jgi:hypothetical protein
MNDAGACGQPLHVAHPETGGGAERVRVIDVARAHDGDGFEAPMRMLRKSGHDVAVVHPPAILTLEILTDVVPAERCGWAELLVASRESVGVVHAEEKRIGGVPPAAERPHAANQVRHPFTIRDLAEYRPADRMPAAIAASRKSLVKKVSAAALRLSDELAHEIQPT